MDAVALQPAISEDLPGFHAGEGMLDTGADLALIASLLLGDPAVGLLWRVRDAAYYLRWRELTADQDGGA